MSLPKPKLNREQAESLISEALERNDTATAATGVVRAYGAELMGFLAALAPSEAVADEAFSLFCEDLWRGIGGFRGESSARTWCYVVARRALYRALRDKHRKREVLGLSEVPGFMEAADQARSTTAIHFRSESRLRLQELKARLEPEELELLTLRIDRRMSWKDIARVLADGEARELDAATLRREAARWRKRFERVKSKLRGWVEAEAPSDPDDSH